MGHFEMDAIQTRDCCVAPATLRADRSDPSLRKGSLLRMTTILTTLPPLSLS
jgi:hypothetical protein